MKIKNISAMKRILVISIVSISALFFLVACGAKEEESPISVSSIELSSSSVAVNGSITVTIHATDKDGRILNYRFTSSAGGFPYFTDSTQNSTEWIAPSVGGAYTITGTAYVGNDEDSASNTATVLDSNKPVITPLYPTEGMQISAVNNEDFSFKAYHANGVYTTYALGLIIHFYVDDVLNDALISNPQFTTTDNKNYTFTFDLDLTSISGNCKLEYGVTSQSNVPSDLVTDHFTVEGVTIVY